MGPKPQMETHDGEKKSQEDGPQLEAPPKRPLPVRTHPSRTHQTNEKQTSSSSGRHSRQQQDPTPAVEERSLRDLTREAYSRSSLHTYKADPLRQGSTSRGRGGNRGGQRGGERGHGQPNMKLRMDAMLEKIKRDFT